MIIYHNTIELPRSVDTLAKELTEEGATVFNADESFNSDYFFHLAGLSLYLTGDGDSSRINMASDNPLAHDMMMLNLTAPTSLNDLSKMYTEKRVFRSDALEADFPGGIHAASYGRLKFRFLQHDRVFLGEKKERDEYKQLFHLPGATMYVSSHNYFQSFELRLQSSIPFILGVLGKRLLENIEGLEEEAVDF